MLNILSNRTQKFNSLNVTHMNFYEGPSSFELPLNIERIDVVPLLNAVVSRLLPLANSKRVTLEMRLLTPSLWCDTHAECFAHLLFNLIDDSLQQTPAGGTVTVDAYQEGHDFILQVSHNGMALSKPEMRILFNLSTSAQSFNKQGMMPQGRLERVKQIVNAHKGELLAESRVGKGTTFKVRLPMIGDVYR